MKIDVAQQLKTFDGRPIVSKEEHEGGMIETFPITLGGMAVEGLMATPEGERPSGEQKLQRFTLAQRIHEAQMADGICDLTADEIQVVKRCIGGALSTQLSGAAWVALENAQSVASIDKPAADKKKRA